MPCFYEQVTCGTPPNVTNTFIQENDHEDANDKHTYNVNDKVEYTCEDASFDMKGNNTATCKYNGQWSGAPQCILKSESSKRISKIILILLGIMFVAVSLLVLILIVKLKRKKLNLQLLTRDKEYEAFVCYDEADTDFAHGPVLTELEEKPVPPFKLLVHQRDFKPGYNIMWNISHVIKNSNSAIIVMSQHFVNAGWCKEEFNACYVENMNDPAFKLFVIMRQSVDTLTNTNEFMQRFFDSKTYLKENVPTLFGKIAEYLTWVKKYKEVEDKNNAKNKPSKAADKERAEEYHEVEAVL